MKLKKNLNKALNLKNILKNKNEEKEYVKTYKDDLYIMIPFTSEKDEQIVSESLNGEVEKTFLEGMNNSSKYQCNINITKDIERFFLGNNYIACLDINRNKKVEQKEEVSLFLTRHKETNIYVLTIMILNNGYSATQLEDQVTINEIFLYEKNNEMLNVDEYMKRKYNLNRCGNAKTLLSISNYPEDKLEFECMLASEVYKNNIYYKINSEELKKQSEDNFTQYEFYDIYASKSAVVYVLHTFDENTIINIKNEVCILFIMEMIMFQEAAVLRTNNKITEKLSQNGLVTLKFIENLYKEFGKTIKFWNRYIFKYETVQNIALKINDAFKTQNTLDEYYKNQEFLEHIVNLRDIQNSNKESKILNGIVLVLTLIQVIPILSEFIDWIFKTNFNKVNIFSKSYILGLSTLFILILILLIKKKVNKNNKRKMK